MHAIKSLHEFMFVRWESERENIPRWKLPFMQFLRIGWVLVLDLYEGRFTKGSMSLVYKTLQSLVPLLALSFSVLHAFGIHNKLRPFLTRILIPFGENSIELSDRIIDFVENIQVGVLGAAGLAILLYTAVTTFQMVENSFNDIWRVRQKNSIFYRFMLYISLLLIGPVLVFSAIGITASFTNAAFISWFTHLAPFRVLFFIFGFMVPYAIVVFIFTLLYKVVPNTKVLWLPAMTGGIFAGLGWEIAQWAFASFIATSSKYEAIYSGFAILIVFFIWLYVSWMILLLGVAIVCYVQYPSLIGIRSEGGALSIRVEEKIALAIMATIGGDYQKGKHSWTMPALAMHFSLPISFVETVTGKMEHAGYIVRLSSDSGAYVPALPPDSVTVADFLDEYRCAGEGRYFSLDSIHAPDAVEQAIEDTHHAVVESLSARSLRDISHCSGTPMNKNESPGT